MQKIIKLPKLIIFDFDNVMYKHREECMYRMLLTSAVTAHSYTGRPLGEMKDVCRENWEKHRDPHHFLKMKNGSEVEKESAEYKKYLAAHHHFARCVRDDVKGIQFAEVPHLVYELSRKTQVCFLSHAMTPTLKMAMTRMGFDRSLVRDHAYGMTCLGGEGWARKNNPDSDVFLWACGLYKVSPHDALVVEDSAENLIGADKDGLNTALISWNKYQYGSHIHTSYETILQFLRQSLKHGLVTRKPPFVQKIA